MIIDPDPPKAVLARRSVASFDSLSTTAARPPSYRSQGSRLTVQPMLDGPDGSTEDLLVKSEKPKLEQRRWWKWLMYLLIAYAVISIAAVVPFLVTHRNDFKGPTPYQRMNPPAQDTDPTDIGTIPVVPANVPVADGKPLACNNWDHTYSYGYPDNTKYSRLSWCIPRTAQSLFLHALNGPANLVKGEFNVVSHPDDDESDFIVDIMVTYGIDDIDGRNSSAVCLMQNGDDWGVGIYTPPKVKSHDLYYKITLYVPVVKDPFVLPQFTTFLPWFTHKFNDLKNTIIFDNIEIGGIASSIDGVLYGQNVNITTTDASITGSYGAQKSLILQTSIGKIDANVTLGSDQIGPTSLLMKSSKGPFSATVNLAGAPTGDNSSLFSGNLSSRAPGFTPAYNTQISCDDSPITLVLRHDATVDSSQLNVEVTTSLNRALVLLDSKFIGSFNLEALNSSVLVTDLDNDTHLHPEVFSNTFPEYYPSGSKRSFVEFDHRSEDRAVGCIQRRDQGPGDGGSNDKGGPQAQVHVQNNMGMVALGFIQSGQQQISSPILQALDITDIRGSLPP